MDSKITVSNESIIDITLSLMELSSKKTKVWFLVSKNIKSLLPHYEHIQKIRTEVVAKYAMKDKDGANIYLDEEKTKIKLGDNEQEVNKIWSEMMKQNIEITVYPITHSDLDMELEPTLMMPLINYIII